MSEEEQLGAAGTWFAGLMDNWLGGFVLNVLMYGVIVVPAAVLIYYVEKNPALIQSRLRS